jgi:septal ring factor EnvC (AmiA/AmiB activator)
VLIEEPSVAVAPPAPAPSRTPLVILVCVAVACTLLAVVFVVMHANARSQRDQSARTIVELEKQVIESGQEEIAANEELKRSKEKEEIQKARTALVASCSDNTKRYNTMAKDTPGRDQVFRIMYDACLSL